MKQLALCLALASVLVPALVWAQEEGLEGDLERQMHLREMDMELEARQTKMEYERRMAELELEARQTEIEQARAHPEGAEAHPEEGGAALLLVICAVVHVLVAVWIYQDLRHRNAGSGLWIVLGLLAGLLAALVYAVVRLGDGDDAKKRTNSR